MSELNIIDCVQGDATWRESRIGMLTASRIGDALTKLKRGGESATRNNMLIELAVERLTRKPAEHYVSKPMERGIELEPLALAAYEMRTGTRITRVGFVLHPTVEWAGCSPDALTADNGLVQAKCPMPHTHAYYLLRECVPEEYKPQCMWEMACTGAAYSDFLSYHPDFPAPLDLFICRLPRDDKRIAEMESEARKFLAEVDTTVLRLKEGLEGALRKSIEGDRA